MKISVLDYYYYYCYLFDTHGYTYKQHKSHVLKIQPLTHTHRYGRRMYAPASLLGLMVSSNPRVSQQHSYTVHRGYLPALRAGSLTTLPSLPLRRQTYAPLRFRHARVPSTPLRPVQPPRIPDLGLSHVTAVTPVSSVQHAVCTPARTRVRLG